MKQLTEQPMSDILLLLVEDNEDDRFLTSRVIRKLPFTVELEICKNGDEAQKRLLAEPSRLPTLMLLDLQLPKMGGIELLTRIRLKFSAKTLPVIILSSSDNPGDIALCRELGISGYLSKPPDLQALLTHIQRALAHQTEQDALPS